VILEVVLEAEVNCPFCARLKPLLEKLCRDLDVPLTIKYLGNRAVAAHEDSAASSTFSPEWVQRWGLPEHKKKLEKIAPVLSYLQNIGAQTFPNVIIKWHDGIRTKEIVVRGFNPRRANEYLRNLYVLLSTLKKVVRR